MSSTTPRQRLIVCAAAAAAAVPFSFVNRASADLIFGDFESGLDPFLEVVQFNVPKGNPPNAFLGSTPTNATHGTMAGQFFTNPGFQQYLRFNNGSKDPGTVGGELANYNSIAFDINVPAGTVPTSFFVHELVINATGFPFVQSGNVVPVQGPPDDLKGRGTVTLKWNYHADPNFATRYATFLADPNAFFQVLLVSNYGNGWDGGSFTIDNLRLTDPVAVGSSWNVGNGNWSVPNNWQPNTVPNAIGATANFGSNVAGPHTVTVDSPQIVGTMNFDSADAYTISGANAITLDVASGQAAINVANGSHTISAPVALNDDVTVTVTPAASVLTVNNLQSSSRALTKSGAGRLDVQNVRAGSLSVNAGTVRVLPSGTSAGTSNVRALTIAGGATPTAKLDITNNALVIDYNAPEPSPLSTVRSQIVAAYNGGSWNGNGITSTSANNTTHGIGYAERSALSSVPAIFGSVDADAVLVRYTRYGDADLNGLVNLIDFNALAANFNQNNRNWSQGDFNYDGLVNLLDFNRVAGNFNQAAAGLSDPTPEDWANLAAAVPETLSAAAVLCALALTLRPTGRVRRSRA